MTGGTRTVLYLVVYPYRMAGANRSLLELVANLPADIRPIVAVTDEGPVAAAFRAAGVECHVLPLAGELNRHGGHLRTLSPLASVRLALRELLPFTLRLRRFIRAHGVDVVHVNDPRGALVAGPAAVAARRPLVMHLRGEMPFAGALRVASEVLPSRVVAVSHAALRTLSPRARRKARVVHNGIRALPPPRAAIPWLEAMRAEGTRVVGCYASVVPGKGHAWLVRAVAELNRRGWGGRLAVLCVGDLPVGYEGHYAALVALLAELGVGNLTFAGWQDDPASFYRYTDVAVLPSYAEGLSRANLESMSCGLPIVGTRIDAIARQVRHGENGLLVDADDAGALADALETLLADPALAVRMGAAGRRRVAEEFSTEAYVAGLVECYDSLRPARGSGRRDVAWAGGPC
ncbi:MAG TPA: glycosyltransferase family 4 protein [Longimicrobium sp.]|jgi:glycosyltransferase involved in cell wall biosynthesis|nr:glycosyltransferase family 4 protein [Longimicrobium sp.]